MARTDVGVFLADKSVRLEAPSDIELNPFHAAGFQLLVNLCARLYPEIRVIAPSRFFEQCRTIALEINPRCNFVLDEGEASATVAWACPKRTEHAIVVAPSGWEILIDLPDSARVQNTNMLASLAAAAVAASVLFRQVFADYLPNGRRAPEPGRFNVLTHSPTADALPDLPSDISIGRVHLVGAGAVGQAAVYALARVSVSGTIVVVDPENISLSNLQRYVLSVDRDAESATSKCRLVERAFGKTKKIETEIVEGPWAIDEPEISNADTVCVAVDSEEVRIAIQAALPRRIYNAWTQPGDIGWSRHESFGTLPCLACLYWPTRTRPSFHENVARALRVHELRVLSYLSANLPIDVVLRPNQIPKLPQYPLPQEAGEWSQRALLDDVAVTLGVEQSELSVWRGRLLPDLYREGICAGALVRKQVTEVPAEMAVPLAHQSVLAGIMLATQLLVASHPVLRQHRSPSIENRLDLLSALPQISARPRQRTPSCLCGDADFAKAFQSRWGTSSQ